MPVIKLFVPRKSILLFAVALFLSASSTAEVEQNAARAGDENSPYLVDASHQQGQSMATWLEQAMKPVTQWISRLRRLPADEKNALAMQPNAQTKAGPWSTGMNEAVAVVQRYYDGVILNVHRLKAEEETYRVKLLQQSGELHAVDYNKTRDQLISANRGEPDADSVD